MIHQIHHDSLKVILPLTHITGIPVNWHLRLSKYLDVVHEAGNRHQGKDVLPCSATGGKYFTVLEHDRPFPVIDSSTCLGKIDIRVIVQNRMISRYLSDFWHKVSINTLLSKKESLTNEWKTIYRETTTRSVGFWSLDLRLVHQWFLMHVSAIDVATPWTAPELSRQCIP